MNAEIFYSKLVSLLKDFFEKNGSDDYREAGTWTKIITKNDEGLSLIDNVLLDLFPNGKLANEYYRIDNCIYENVDEGKVTKNNMNFHQWRLVAAVEHENIWNDWSDELVKLTYIQCPLRVVISYGNINFETGEYDTALKHANQVAKAIHLENYVHNGEEFALIFGPRLSDSKKSSSIAELYRLYVWNGTEFVKSKNKEVIR